jgi:hypothetical protein
VVFRKLGQPQTFPGVGRGKFVIPVFNQLFRALNFILVLMLVFLYDIFPSAQVRLCLFDPLGQCINLHTFSLILLRKYDLLCLLNRLMLPLQHLFLRKDKTIITQTMRLDQTHLQGIFFANLSS